MRLYGWNPVVERLRTQPKSIKRIYIQEHHAEVGYIHKKAQQWNIPIHVIPASKMLKLTRSLNSQGILVEIDEFAYVSYTDVLNDVLKDNRVIFFLDRINDPQNLGSILRSLACFGDFALVLPTHHSVSVTEAVLRVACGGENYVPVAQVANLTNAVRLAKEAGLMILGSVPEGGENILETTLSFPLGIVIGSEQQGIREVFRKHLDKLVTIPMRRSRLSLNVSQAAGVLGYEIMRQRFQIRQK